MNQKQDKNTPRFDIQLLFDQIGVLLDDNQYRDAISLVDMYHFYARQHQVRKPCKWCIVVMLMFMFTVQKVQTRSRNVL